MALERNVPGRWLREVSEWRKIALNTWSKPDNPTVFGTLEIEVGPLLGHLARVTDESGVKCTMTHAVTRAIAVTLRRHPDANVYVRGSRLWQRDEVDVFLQVAMPTGDPAGRADLSGTVIRRADTKSIAAIATELRDKAARVRERRDGEMATTRGLLSRLPSPVVRAAMEVLGALQYDLNLAVPGSPRDPFGSAMVTSVGMLGISTAFAPLVTFSRCPIILLVGRVEERPVVRDGAVVVRTMCTLTVTFDHRIFDGYQGGHMARTLCELLERPDLLDP
jgi:pyruvate dehydrogenase E2 component (dihydrolipoamide acetyltransferase)